MRSTRLANRLIASSEKSSFYDIPLDRFLSLVENTIAMNKPDSTYARVLKRDIPKYPQEFQGFLKDFADRLEGSGFYYDWHGEGKYELFDSSEIAKIRRALKKKDEEESVK